VRAVKVTADGDSRSRAQCDVLESKVTQINIKPGTCDTHALQELVLTVARTSENSTSREQDTCAQL
jgi:hypothetical protein